MVNKIQKYTEVSDTSFYNFHLEIKEYFGINNGIIRRLIKLFGFSKKGEITEPFKRDINSMETLLRKKFKIGDIFKKQLEIKYKRYLKIKSYRGFRHKFKLPANGQRTKVNAKTSRKQKVINLGTKYNKDIFILKIFVLKYTTEKDAEEY